MTIKAASKRIFVVGFLSILTITGGGFCFAEEFYPAQVCNISDREYEQAVIELLDNAEESIVVSMYILKLNNEKGPVSLLLEDLEEALERGVSVEIYLNTRFHGIDKDKIGSGEGFDRLRKKGAVIYFVSDGIRLHDKVVIADNRYIVLGSANWTVSALKDNYEASLLTDAPELAQELLARIRKFPLEGEDALSSQRAKRGRTLPQKSSVILSKAVLEDENLFPRMVSGNDSRAMNMYLLLLRYAQIWQEREFFISLEDAALDLGMPLGWSNTALRRQAIRTLKKLQNKYKLIEVDFWHGRDARVSLKELKGDTFKVGGYYFSNDFLSSKMTRTKFVLLIQLLLEEEGTSISSLENAEISKRFHIKARTLRSALQDINTKNQ